MSMNPVNLPEANGGIVREVSDIERELDGQKAPQKLPPNALRMNHLAKKSASTGLNQSVSFNFDVFPAFISFVCETVIWDVVWSGLTATVSYMAASSSTLVHAISSSEIS